MSGEFRLRKCADCQSLWQSRRCKPRVCERRRTTFGGSRGIGGTLASVLDSWLEHRSAQLSPATVDRYRVAIQRTRLVIGRMAVARLEPHHLEDFYAKLHREGLSGASIRKIHWAMRQSLAWAKRCGYITHLATDGVELPPFGAKSIVPPSSDSVAKLIEFALDDRSRIWRDACLDCVDRVPSRRGLWPSLARCRPRCSRACVRTLRRGGTWRQVGEVDQDG